MNKFKIGDRVVAIENTYSYGFVYFTEGEKGTVKEVFDYFASVEFDNDVNGWGDKQLGIKGGCGAFVNYDKLKLLKERKKR